MDKKIGDAKKAADYARNNANTKSVGECAKYVANALFSIKKLTILISPDLAAI